MMKIDGQLKKKPAEALRASEDLLRKDPFNPSFVNLACKAALAADMPEVAIMNLEMAREANPNDIKSLEWLAELYTQVERMKDAREIYEDLVRKKPNDPEMVRKLKDASALDTVQKGRWDSASSYRDVMKDSKAAILLEQQGKAVKSEGDVSALMAETKAKIEREPQNINYRRALADLHQKAGQLDEALEVLASAQQLTGGADPQIERLITTVQAEKFDRAIAALEASGSTAEAAAKRAEKDAFLFQTAEERVRRYPNDLQFKYELGIMLFDRGQFNEAVQQLQRAQQNPQRRTMALYYLARCFREKGQLDIAVEQLEKAAAELHQMDDTKKEIVYELGTLHESMGQIDKAVALFKEIYGVDIGFRDVTAKIENAYRRKA